jgi:membrane-bound serine protease (ClpP class)
MTWRTSGQQLGLSGCDDAGVHVTPADRTGRGLRALAALLLSGTAVLAARAAPVPVLDVRDAIGPASAGFIIRSIGKAAEARAPLIVIRLDTPGGLDTSMRDIIQAILASRVPVAVYVSPSGSRAASAGTYILYAAHIAAMAPATTLGAATPVAIGMPGPGGSGRAPAGDEGEPAGAAKNPPKDGASEPEPGRKAPPLAGADAMTAKQIHDAAAFIRGLAQQRGRNAEWAERAVREAVSLTATEALKANVIDVVAEDLDDLLARINGRRVKVEGREVTLATTGLAIEVIRPDWRQRLLSVIANPSFALVLLMLGIYGLLFEFASPGFGVPGTVGAICLVLGLFALQLLPVNYAGLGLILLGVALLAAEAMAPSFGVLGVGGLVAFVVGALLLFDSDVPGFGVPLWLIAGLAISSAAFVVLGGGMALRARRRPVVSGREQMLGSEGVVLVPAGSETWALVHGERWRVTSPDALSTGQRVRVVGMKGLTLEVRAAGPSASSGEKT